MKKQKVKRIWVNAKESLERAVPNVADVFRFLDRQFSGPKPKRRRK